MPFFLLFLQECSPYAAHLFDAEDANTPMRLLPGLCGDYCFDYWNQCRYTLSLLLENMGSPQQFSNLTAILEEDRTKFCDFLELRDKQYCYPNVLTNEGTVLRKSLESACSHLFCLFLFLLIHSKRQMWTAGRTDCNAVPSKSHFCNTVYAEC